MPRAPEELARALLEHLRGLADPDRAAHQKAYLKSELEFLGVTVPDVRRAATALHRERPDLTRSELMALVDSVWEPGIHELRLAAVELLRLYDDILVAADATLVERLIREAGTWALVDGLATHVAGSLRERFPGPMDAVIARWARDGDFWIRRAALLAYLNGLRHDDNSFDRFAAHADRMLEDPEFFIRKAIGWVLREAAKTFPEHVAGWLEPRAHRASALTLREATKYLPPEVRARIAAARPARRARRPGTTSLILAAAVITALPATGAAQQFVVDDAPVVEAGACQIEVWHGRLAGWAIPACHVFTRLEVAAGVGWILGSDGSRDLDLVVQGKYALRDLEPNDLGVSLVVGVGLGPVAQVMGRAFHEVFAYVPVSVSLLDDRLVLHANAGWSLVREPHGDHDHAHHHLILGARADAALHDRVTIIAELFGEAGETPEYQAGLRTAIIPERLHLDLSYGDRIRNPDRESRLGLVVGLAWTPPPFY